MEVKYFSCDDLSKYTDSMLFDSREVIAEGKFGKNGKDITIFLKVCGEVAVTYDEVTYHKPSEFPKELKEIIKKYPNKWDVESPLSEKIYIGLNNWFEFILPEYGDGIVYEGDLVKETPAEILEQMTYIIEQYILE